MLNLPQMVMHRRQGVAERCLLLVVPGEPAYGQATRPVQAVRQQRHDGIFIPVIAASVAERFALLYALEILAESLDLADKTVGTAGPTDWIVGFLLILVEVEDAALWLVVFADNLVIAFLIGLLSSRLSGFAYWLLILGMAADKLLIVLWLYNIHF